MDFCEEIESLVNTAQRMILLINETASFYIERLIELETEAEKIVVEKDRRFSSNDIRRFKSTIASSRLFRIVSYPTILDYDLVKSLSHRSQMIELLKIFCEQEYGNISNLSYLLVCYAYKHYLKTARFFLDLFRFPKHFTFIACI